MHYGSRMTSEADGEPSEVAARESGTGSPVSEHPAETTSNAVEATIGRMRTKVANIQFRLVKTSWHDILGLERRIEH